MSENRPTPQDSRDPLATLHRMSTTAGAASQEYVAINLAAVTTLVLGVASALVFFGNVLFIVPIAAIIFGIAAIRQIRGSSGTQTGTAMAVLGMLLAVGFSGAVSAQKFTRAQEIRAEKEAINALVAKLEQYIITGDYAGSLNVFTERFPTAKEVTPQRVEQVWSSATQNPAFGKIVSIKTNDRVVLEDAAPDGTRNAGSMLQIKFEKVDEPLRRNALFRKANGEWKIDDIPELFPPLTPPVPPGPPGGMPGPM